MKKLFIFSLLIIISAGLYSQGEYDYPTNKYTGKKDMVLKKSVVVSSITNSKVRFNDTIWQVMNDDTLEIVNDGIYLKLYTNNPMLFTSRRGHNLPLYDLYKWRFVDSTSGANSFNCLYLENKNNLQFSGVGFQFIMADRYADINATGYPWVLNSTCGGFIDLNAATVVGSGGSSQAARFQVRVSGQYALVIDTAQRVGIGRFITENGKVDSVGYDGYYYPRAKLHINGFGETKDLLRIENDKDWLLDSTATFTGKAWLGLGTTIPIRRLDVRGGARFSDTIWQVMGNDSLRIYCKEVIPNYYKTFFKVGQEMGFVTYGGEKLMIDSDVRLRSKIFPDGDLQYSSGDAAHRFGSGWFGDLTVNQDGDARITHDSTMIWRTTTLVADSGTILLPDAKTSWGTIIVGDNEEYVFNFRVAADGTVSIPTTTPDLISANFVNTNTDAKACLYDGGGTQAIFRNNLGSSKTVTVECHYRL